MQVISYPGEAISGNVLRNQAHLFKNMSQYLSQYMISMFEDFTEVITRKLNTQQQKIIKNEQKIKQLLNTIQLKRTFPQDSLNQVAQGQSKQTLKHQNISFNIQPTKMQQINKALWEMESDILRLERSLKDLRQMQDPENQSELIKVALTSLQNQQQTQMAMSDIRLQSKLVDAGANQKTKNSRIAALISGTHEPKLFKSNSVMSIPSRKYYTLSCPKRSFCGHNQKRKQQQQICLGNRVKLQYLKTGGGSAVQFSGFSKNEKNKMPLINKSKSVIDQLLLSVGDQGDANLVKFYLKKSLNKLEQLYFHNNHTPKGYQVSQRKYSIKTKQQIHNKKEAIPEYFAKETNTSKNCSVTANQRSGCSIGNLRNNNEQSQNSFKESPSSVYFQEMNSENKNNRKQNVHLQNNCSRQKRKYFQRTSNQQKVQFLKRNPRPTGANC